MSRKFITFIGLLLGVVQLLPQAWGLDLTHNWQVIREADKTRPPDSNDSRWQAFEPTLKREYRINHPYEPGMAIWLKNSFTVSSSLANQKYLVLSIGNRRIIQDVFLNGHKLKDIGKIQWKALLPEPCSPNSPFRGNFIFTGRETHLWDVPALFLAPRNVFKAGNNTLVCQIYESDAYNEYLNKVELRTPTLADRFFPVAASKMVGATDSEAIIELRRRVPEATPLTMHINIYNNVGKLLRTQQRKVEYTRNDTKIILKPETSQDYRAEVTFSHRNQTTSPLWVYYGRRLMVNSTRQSFSLEGEWRHLGLTQGEKVKLPPPSGKWQKVIIPGRILDKQGLHRYYLQRSFKVPAALTAKRIVLRLGTVFGKADVYINNRLAGTTSVHDAPTEFDITKLLHRKGKNTITLLLTDWSAFLKPGSPKVKDGDRKALRGTSLTGFALDIRHGLTGYVELLAVPDVRIRRIWIIPSVSKRELTIKTWVENAGSEDTSIKFDYQLYGKVGKLLEFPGQTITVPAGKTITTTFTKQWNDPPLWSIENPQLCNLEVKLMHAQRLVDVATQRFGFREITKRGRDILVNGKKIHLAGSSNSMRKYYYPKDAATLAYYLRQAKQRGFNHARVQNIQHPPKMYWDVYDEVGYTSHAESSLDDMNQARIDYGNPQLHNNGIKEFKAFILEYFNHPGIFVWDYGNEVFYANNAKNKDLERGFTKVVRAIKAFDPTRLVTQSGSEDFPGADTFNPHYPIRKVIPNELYFLNNPINNSASPSPKPETAISHRNPPFYPNVRPWGQDKPIIIGETSWLRKRWGSGSEFFGAMSYKPSPHRYYCTYPTAGTMAAFGRERELDVKGYRMMDVSAYAFHLLSLLSSRNARLITALFVFHNAHFYSDKSFVKEVTAFNDSGQKNTFTVELTWDKDGKQIGKLRRKVELDNAQQQRLKFKVPSISATQKPVEIIARLAVVVAGKTTVTETQKWTIFPKLTDNKHPNTTIAVLDPGGSLKGLFAAFKLKVHNIASASDLPEKTKLLVLGENLSKQTLSVNADTISTFVKKGGTVLVMRQQQFGKLLPVKIERKLSFSSSFVRAGENYGASTQIYAPTHPIFAGLLPEDFRYWGLDPLNLVHSLTYTSPESGNARVLAGNLEDAILIEIPNGKGRYIVSSLELTPEKAVDEPVVNHILENIINYSENPNPEPSKTLVMSPGKPQIATLLKDKVSLIAQYTQKCPQSLRDYQLIILTDADKHAPTANTAEAFKKFVTKGGTLFVDRPGANTCRWLGQVIGTKVSAKPYKGGKYKYKNHAAKRIVDPLLAGIAEENLVWGGVYRTPRIKPFDIILKLITIPGAKALTEPAALQVLPLGNGRIVVSSMCWDKFNSPKPLRVIRALLTNVGAKMTYHAPTEKEQATTDFETGVTFTLVDIRTACNRSRQDEAPHDNKGGWIDMGTTDLRMLPSGPKYFNGVLFDIVAPKPDNANTCIMLGTSYLESPVALRKLDVESREIPVNQTAQYIYFLQTSAYASTPSGITEWMYEIRYEGFSKLIPGLDYTPYVNRVPVKSGIDVCDWIVGNKPPSIPYAWQGRTGTAGTLPCYLYMQKWINPYPKKRIESIKILGMNSKSTPVILAITLGNKAPNLLPAGDVMKLPLFGNKFENGKKKPLKGHRWRVKGWRGNCTKYTSAIIASQFVPGFKDLKAMSIQIFSGIPFGQAWLQQPVSLDSDNVYALTFEYLTGAKALGIVRWGIQNDAANVKVILSDYLTTTRAGWLQAGYPWLKLPLSGAKTWQRFFSVFGIKQNADKKPFFIHWQNRGKTPHDILYFKDIQLYKINRRKSGEN